MDHDTQHCRMSMLWNYQIEGTCIVFRSWHITGGFTFVISFIIIVLLSITYEWLRKLQRAVDIQTAQQVTKKNAAAAASDTPDTPLLGAIPKQYPVPLGPRVRRALLYGISTFLSFFLMLVFMTFNAYLCAAVAIGAAVGHFIYGAQIEADAVLAGVTEAKGMSCC